VLKIRQEEKKKNMPRGQVFAKTDILGVGSSEPSYGQPSRRGYGDYNNFSNQPRGYPATSYQQRQSGFGPAPVSNTYGGVSGYGGFAPSAEFGMVSDSVTITPHSATTSIYHESNRIDNLYNCIRQSHI
jgi:hypothetical protein